MSIFLPNQHLGGETDHHHRDHLVGHQTFHRASLYPISLVISNIIGENDISNIKESDWEIISDDIGNDYIPNPVAISNITVEALAAALCKNSPNSHTQPNPTPTRKSSYGAGCFTQGTTCIINPLTAT